MVGDTTPDVVARSAGVSPAEAANALALATEHGVIVDGAIDEPVAARLLADMGTASVAGFHLRVVHGMLIHGWEDLNDLIRHIRAAAALVPIPEVVDRIDHAAKVALSTSDYHGARALLDLADEVGNPGDLEQRAWRFCRLAEAYDGLGQVTKAREAAGRAFHLAEMTGNRELCLEASIRSVFPTDWHAGDFQSAALLQRLEDLGPPSERLVAVHAAQAIAEMRIPVFEHEGQQVAWVTRASVAQPLANKALADAPRANRADRLLAVLAWRTCHRAPRFLEQRRAVSSEALDLSQQLHLPARQVEAACFLAVDAIESWDWGLFEKALSVATWVAKKDGNPRLLAHTKAMEAGAAFRNGDVESGEQLRCEAVDHATRVGLSSAYSLQYVLLAEHLVTLDEPPPVSAMPAEDDPILHHPLGRAVAAVGWARLGDPDKAARFLN